MYAINGKEIDRYAKEARVSNLSSFVAYGNGDTIKGTTLKIKLPFMHKDKPKWFMDGKEISSQNITSYQDKNGYRIGGYTRLINGKLNLFVNQSVSTSFGKTSTFTSFYILLEAMRSVSYSNLKIILKDCPAALTQIDKEFIPTGWAKPKNKDVSINDYRALIRIIKIYNACN
ncbi:MAG: hypothetical protein AAB221_09805 [Bacteroidota bacterium]